MHDAEYNNLVNILDGMMEGIITVDSRGIIKTFNKSAEDIFGYTADEILGQNIRLLMPESVRAAHDAYLSQFTESAEVSRIGRKLSGLKKNGDSVPLRITIREYPKLVRGEKWFIASCVDITLQEKQEEQMQNSIKMDAIGKLSSGIAHDYNNVLNIIVGFGELLKDNLQDSPDLVEYVNQILHAADRGSDLSRKLLTVSKRKTGEEEVVNLNKVLQENRELIKKTVTAQVQIAMDLDAELWSTFCDRGYLESAILNITINAIHAMPEGGRLEFTTGNGVIDSVEGQVLNIPAGEYVIITIRDTGIGMSKETQSHIFEPFFTTKQEKGTGLGLSQVYGFVTRSGGTIKVSSEPGKGSCFALYLPRYVDTTDKDDTDPQARAVSRHQSGTVLVVDDEPAIRELSKTILSSYGYHVMIAENGQHALELLAHNKVDIVISDVIMPGMDGYELAHTILHTYPKVKIQLTSGYADIRGKTVTNDELYANILPKPFTTDELLSSISSLR